MRSVYVVFHNGKLLQRPFAHIYQRLYLFPGIDIKPVDSLLEFWLELAVVRYDKSKTVNCILQPSSYCI